HFTYHHRRARTSHREALAPRSRDFPKASLRRMNMTRIAAALLVLALAGCAGTDFRWEDTEKVHDGMTEAEIIAILGAPYQRVQAAGGMTVLTWSYATALGGHKAV